MRLCALSQWLQHRIETIQSEYRRSDLAAERRTGTPRDGVRVFNDSANRVPTDSETAATNHEVCTGNCEVETVSAPRRRCRVERSSQVRLQAEAITDV